MADAAEAGARGAGEASTTGAASSSSPSSPKPIAVLVIGEEEGGRGGARHGGALSALLFQTSASARAKAPSTHATRTITTSSLARSRRPPNPRTAHPTARTPKKGMAGSGKTTLVQRIHAHLHQHKLPGYIINLDPAVGELPYGANIDIRDTVRWGLVRVAQCDDDLPAAAVAQRARAHALTL